MGLPSNQAATVEEADAEGVRGAPAGEAPPESRWDWARNWELWLALVVGGFLRLWHLDLSSFLIDQSTITRLARTAVVGHLIPVTSVSYSVGGYAPPFGLDLLVPFALFTHDPFPVLLSIALWNILGVALCYRFALKYYGRLVAAIGTLLLATCSVAVNYSRFIWQPNYETTFLVLWALALFAWCIGGRRVWFAVSVILLLILLEISLVAVLLIPITAVAWFLTSARPSGRDYAVIGVVSLLILSPTLLWETITQGLDITQLLHSSGGQPSTFSLTVLRVIYATIGSHGSSGLGPVSLLDRFGGVFTLTNLLALIFLVVGYAILSWRVLAPAVRVWRGGGASDEATASRGMARIAPWWRTLRADRRWCVELLLWLWVTLPPLSMLRHSSPPTAHYLLIAYPALFLVAAYPVYWLHEVDLLGRLTRRPLPAVLNARTVSFAGLALVGLLITAQTVQCLFGTASLVSPGFQAYLFYGIPMASVQSAESQITRLQQVQGDAAVYISLPANQRFYQGMDYLLVGEHTDRVSSADDCLVLPTGTASRSLVVSTTADSPAAALLPRLSNAKQITDIPVLGSAPFAVYEMSGAVPQVTGEVPVSAATYHPTSNDSLRLDAAALDGGRLRLRWTVLAAPTASVAPEAYTIQMRSASGGASSALSSVNCAPTRWAVGDTMFTWLPLGSTGSTPGAISLSLLASAPHFYTPEAGPLHLLSGRVVGDTLATVPPTGASTGSSTTGSSGVAPDGGYYLSLAGLG